MSSVSTPAKSGGARQGVQKFGRFLSAMVMPNIGAFIAWGLLTALFIPTGWWPNEAIATMIGPMITYLLPLLIAYSGGKMLADHRGGVIAAIATMGVIVGAGDVKMFIGAMIMGPLAGWIIKQFDRSVEGKIPAGFEMLVNNFSLGIIGAALAVGGYYGIGPLVGGFTNILESGVQTIVNWGVLPLVSIFVEPGKILFLNNAINHGIFSPLGLEESQRLGKSIFFLIEANPGPGLGVLLAYWVFAKGSIKSSAPGAIIIHFLGGIHEIYFPYVLMRPVLILSVILGGMAGVFTFTLTGAGLVSAASPGSIIALMLVSPKGGQLAVLAGVAAAAIVSFLVSAIFLRNYKADDEDLAKAREASQAMKGSKTGAAGSAAGTNVRVNGKVEKIVFACDAGMGSSAMGASSFRKKVKAAGLPINVTNTAIENIPSDADIVVTQQNLTDRARAKAPNAHHVSIDNFINNPVYEDLIEELKASQAGGSPAERNTTATPDAQWDIDNALDKVAPGFDSSNILRKENIRLGLPSVSKEEAIREAGRMLSAAGYVKPGYVDAMIEREGVASTYIGNGVAIPHGVGTAKNEIENSGIVVLQYPNGVEFEGGTAYLVIGIAGARGEHLKILTKIAEAIEDESTVQRLAQTRSVDDVYNVLSVQPE